MRIEPWLLEMKALALYGVFIVHSAAAFNAQDLGPDLPNISIQTIAASSTAPMASAALLALASETPVDAFDSAMNPCP
jgi:hypothetical protein